MYRDGLSWRGSWKPLLKFMEEKAPKHKRSKSDLPNINLGEDIKECIFVAPLQQKQDMGQQKGSPELGEKQAIRSEVGMQDQQKPAEDLIKEIVTLEMQVVQLEQHLLSLYRKQFDQQVSPLYTKDKDSQSTPSTLSSENAARDIRYRRDDNLNYSGHFVDQQLSELFNKEKEKHSMSARFFSEHHGRDIRSKMDEKLNVSAHHVDQRLSALLHKDLEPKSTSARFLSEHQGGDIRTKKDDNLNSSAHFIPRNSEFQARKGTDKSGEQKILDSTINRTHSSLSQHFSIKYSTIQKIVAEAPQSDHSLPLSIFEAQDEASCAISRGKHFDVTDAQLDHVPETPNWLSEEMIKCISIVYFTIADPPADTVPRRSSPFSYMSALDEFGPEDRCEMWNQSLGSHLENSFINEKSKFSGTYCSMIEVKHICRDNRKLKDADDTLQKFRDLVHRLEKVDPRKLKHRQKLAFWINVHNALVMHAFLVYGIPQNNLKRTSLVLKAAYNVGGQVINVEMIQRSLLGCCLPRPGQWLQSLLFPKTKFKVNDPRRLFAIDHAEPLLYYALCAGSQSDPAVRVYTPVRIYKELEAAKDDYIQLALRVHKEHKILLPKMVELFAKDCDLNPAGFVELLEPYMPTSLRKSIKPSQRAKFWKSIQWGPHNFDFRYLLSGELVS